MRSEQEMTRLILDTARNDERIRAVIMCGSRADRNAPRDIYQDYDIVYLVRDVAPFYDNDEWVKDTFGAPAIMQKPESVTLIPPANDGTYAYLMLFPDGNRIDLTVKRAGGFTPDGEPAVVLLDKDGILSDLSYDEHCFDVKAPSEKHYADCCNEFYWCMNNVAKGIARGEVPYAMEMLNVIVRGMLDLMTGWYIGAHHNFSVSPGKMGKYFGRYLPAELYGMYLRTYSTAAPEDMWNACFVMCELFGTLAVTVAEKLGFSYNKSDEQGIIAYMTAVRGGKL